MGGDIDRYAGNSERFFPLFLGLFVRAVAIGMRAWTTIDISLLPQPTRRLDASSAGSRWWSPGGV